MDLVVLVFVMKCKSKAPFIKVLKQKFRKAHYLLIIGMLPYYTRIVPTRNITLVC